MGSSKHTPGTRGLLGASVVVLLVVFPAFSSIQTVALTPTNSISNHWLSQQSCYRDELNQSDTDYYNCWLDNTGKILTSSVLSGDSTDTRNSLLTLTKYGLNVTNSYLPEAIVNSSDVSSSRLVTNRIAALQASNQSSTLEELAIGNYYEGEAILGYIGSDRLDVNGTIYRSTNATVYQTSDGFVKRSLFTTPNASFYVYVNATVTPGNPYVDASIQVMPVKTFLNSSDFLYLQVFSNSGQFDNVSLYDGGGNYLRPLSYDNGSPSAQNGTIIAYSKQDNVFTEDSVAISINYTNSQVSDFEHWYQNPAFDNLSWFGIGYNSPDVSSGNMSAPIYAKIYPIEHMDYRLINDTAKYIAENVKNTTVSPPVSFGFIAYGLALASQANPSNQTLASLARNYWSYYYSRYASSVYYTPYARSINTFALAGFTLYGCNNTVEQFTHDFLGNTSGGSIEESGWAVAATYHLQACSELASDRALYESFLQSFVASSQSFARVVVNNNFVSPSATFQFGEAASGLMLGGVPYNSPIVLALMSAVFQSNVSGTVLNYPYIGDLANTETLPAYSLSTCLFNKGMQNETGYTIAGLNRVNVTLLDYTNGTLFIGADGNNGTITISHNNSSQSFVVNGGTVIQVPRVVSTVTKTMTAVSTTSVTVTHVSTTTYATTTTVTSSNGLYHYSIYLAAGLTLAVLGVAFFGFALLRWKRRTD